jgi:AcrR family transcriptional regulator
LKTLADQNMLAPNGRRKRDRAARERALVLAATRLFATRGFESATTREIAAEAGCAEGLIHRYFGNKAGLLAAIIEGRTSPEVEQRADDLPPAAKLENEILQLVDREIEHAWENRDFLRVTIPRTILDPALGQVSGQIGSAQRAQAIIRRLRQHPKAGALASEGLEVLADTITMIGFMFGFVRPVLFGEDRARARKAAMEIAWLLASGIVSASRRGPSWVEPAPVSA